MKCRKLGRDGPSVSAIGMGRGSRTVRPGDPLEQEFNSAIRRACELGIAYVAYVAYAPLGRGLLTGRIRHVEDRPENDPRRRHPRFAPENLAPDVERNAGAVDLELSQDELSRLDESFPIGAGAGLRYRERALKGMGI